MGMLVNGRWQGDDLRTGADGDFVRPQTVFRNWVTADGRPGPSGEGGFEAAAGRYHLYVSLACPWAHRTLIVRKLKDSATQSRCQWSIHSWVITDGRSTRRMVRSPRALRAM